MSEQLRDDLPPLPRFMQYLPISRGYPVPWFVEWINGAPEFRVSSAVKLMKALSERRCWVCGQALFREEVFVIGPMCAFNRVSSEPPSHRECAEFSARACPFLTKPHMTRREDNLPEERTKAAGIMIARNPGVILLWYTYRHQVMHLSNGILIKVGSPFKVEWVTEGRPATRAEVLESINSGLPALREAAALGGPESISRSEEDLQAALKLVPGK